MKAEPTVDWPPTWPRDAEWTCPDQVPECPSRAWHNAHIHFRRFANLSPTTREWANDS